MLKKARYVTVYTKDYKNNCMNFCDSNNHKDLAWDGSHKDNCPLCEALDLIEDLNETIEELQEALEAQRAEMIEKGEGLSSIVRDPEGLYYGHTEYEKNLVLAAILAYQEEIGKHD